MVYFLIVSFINVNIYFGLICDIDHLMPGFMFRFVSFCSLENKLICIYISHDLKMMIIITRESEASRI